MLAANDARAQPPVQKNVVYGMYSGLALLMDVHRPEKQNGYGVIFVPGSGWHASLAYDAVPVKETQITTWDRWCGPGTRCSRSIIARRPDSITPPRWKMCSAPCVSFAITP